jgi:site-specific DNA-methyltransferase (adenine-specific)/modification methylase
MTASDNPLVVRLSDSVTIIRGDCYTLLDAWPSDAALVTDPPYGIALPCAYGATRQRSYEKQLESTDKNVRQHAWKAKIHKPIHGDNRAFDPSPFLGFKRVCLWGANNYADRLPARYSWLAWDKRDNRGPRNNFGDCELAWCAGVPFNSVRMFHHMWLGYNRDSEIAEGSLHPTQKPVALLAWCLETCGVTDGLVIDPFMGSGSLGVACHRAGLRYLGVEIDADHFETAQARLKKELEQGRLAL